MNTRTFVPLPSSPTRLWGGALLAALLLSACGGAAGPIGWQAGAPGSWSSAKHPSERLSATHEPFQGAPSDLASRILESVVLAPGGGKMLRTHAMSECPGAAGEMEFVRKSPPRRIVVFFSIRNNVSYEIRWSGAVNDVLPPEVLTFAQRRLCRVI